jgi:hypothetical protein
MPPIKAKLIVLAFAAIFIAAALFSLPAALAGIDHDCGGENCPICACMARAQDFCKQLAAAAICPLLILPSLVTALLTGGRIVRRLKCPTPVTLKIKMNC